MQYEKGQADAAKTSLSWVGDNAKEEEYRSIARLRLAGLLLEAKQYDAALKALDEAKSKEFSALVADRRGDVLLAQGKKEQALAAYQIAFKDMGDKQDYRHLIEAKLIALAAPPAPTASGVAK